MENHHYSWENPLFLWAFSIAMLNYQRVCPVAAMTVANSVPSPTFASRSRPTSQGSLVACSGWGPRSVVSNSNTQMVQFPAFQSILQLVFMNPWTKHARPQSTGIVGEIAQSSFRCQSIFPAKKESCCQI